MPGPKARRATGALDQDRVTGAQQRSHARALGPLRWPARAVELVPGNALDEREVPPGHGRKGGQADARRRSDRRATARSRENLRQVDQEPRRRGHLLRVASGRVLVSVLRVVPVVQTSVRVRFDRLRQEVQVPSLGPVDVKPQDPPAERLSEEQAREQHEEEGQRPLRGGSSSATPCLPAAHHGRSTIGRFPSQPSSSSERATCSSAPPSPPAPMSAPAAVDRHRVRRHPTEKEAIA